MGTALAIAAGLFDVGIGLFHLGFWRLFRWREQLPRLSALNAAVMQALNVSLTLLAFILGGLLVAHAAELPHIALGRELLVLMAGFWIARAVQQAVFFRLRHARSVGFALLCVLGAALHALPVIV